MMAGEGSARERDEEHEVEDGDHGDPVQLPAYRGRCQRTRPDSAIPARTVRGMRTSPACR
jgi:hypothetical protein